MGWTILTNLESLGDQFHQNEQKKGGKNVPRPKISTIAVAAQCSLIFPLLGEMGRDVGEAEVAD